MVERIKNSKLILACINFIFVLVLLLVFMMVKNMAPFGNATFAGMDANVQYADFFNYYRNVLLGKDSFIFSLSNLLGDSGIAIFGYYLASPLNLLILFFKAQDVGTIFFNILFILKISLAAAFFSIFISNWFGSRRKPYFNIVFSICYAFMQYNAAQASNIIWLDGVYMLPLILLGIHRGINANHWGMLGFMIGCSLIFNWYTGIINCLFSFIWFLFETIYEKRKFLGALINYLVASASGVLMSGIAFYPVYKVMKESSRNGFDWNLLKIGLNGNPLNVISNYAIGVSSSQGSVSLYCGMLTLIFVIALFFSDQVTQRIKFIFGTLVVVTISLFYFTPLVLAFSVFKEVDSYWYRYSYVGIVVILFIALFYINSVKLDFTEKKHLLTISVIVVFFEFVLAILKKQNGSINYLLSGVFLIGSILLLLATYYNRSKNKVALLSLLILTISFELLFNLAKEYKIYEYTTITAKDYSSYVKSQNKLIDSVKQKDSGLYRVTQTKTRLSAGDRTLTANYNEGMGYNYPSISGYTSSPSEQQLRALERLGYRTEQQRISVVNTSILPTDSLLGVKYVLSPSAISGLKYVRYISSQNNKRVFVNPYAFPMAFVGPSVRKIAFNGNTFNYQEKIIDNLVGRKINIYNQVNYNTKRTNDSLIFNLAPQAKGPIYGNLPWNPKYAEPTNLFANGKKVTAYSQWLSPSVFYVPENTTQLKLRGNIYQTSPEFYQVNLVQLRRASRIVQKRAVKVVKISSTRFEVRTKGNENPYLYLSIPNSDNWSVQNNGKPSRHQNIYGVFLQVPLHKGENRLSLTYHTPGIIIGAIMSLFGIAIITLQIIFLKREFR